MSDFSRQAVGKTTLGGATEPPVSSSLVAPVQRAAVTAPQVEAWSMSEGLLGALGLSGDEGSIDRGPAVQRRANGEGPAGPRWAGGSPTQSHGDAESDRDESQRQGKDKSKSFIPHTIHVVKAMTGEEYKVHAMNQVFGGVLPNVVWANIKDSYGPDGSPYTLNIDVALLKRHRASVSKAKGIEVDSDGRIAGAEERGKQFQTAPESDVKSALMKEIDRRYCAAIGAPVGTKIHRGEKDNAELWFQIRDEVLFQHEYLVKLPPKVKELIKLGIKGRELTLADYDKLFTVVKKIEHMSPGQVNDYASKIAGSTTELDAFEAALDKYSAEMAQRDAQAQERDAIKTKLLGLEETYKEYRRYRSQQTTDAITSSIGAGVPGAPIMLPGTPTASGMMRKDLETQLKRHGFASISEFEAFIKKFEKAFELEASNIAKDLLAKYAGKLYKESERYKDPKEVSALHQKLGGLRTHHAEFEKNAKISNDYQQNSELSRLPGNGHLRPKIGPAEAKGAYDKASAAKAVAQGEIQSLAGSHPIFQEEGLPLDKRLDKAALAKASEQDLGGLIQSHIASRHKDIGEAREHLGSNPELIYKLDKLLPQFYVQQSIAPGSIYDLIIQDKMKDDAILKLIGGIVVAVVAIALAVVSFGVATPAIAAGAAAAGFGLSAYMAYDEYQHYVEAKDLADVGFAEDPSVVWLVIAVAGAAVDMAAAVKAMKVLGPAAKVLDGGGELAEFAKLVKALEKSGEIDAKLARAAEKAAAARKGFAAATGDLAKAMSGKLYSFPGPLADPDVFRALVRMAREGLGTVFHESVHFLEHIKQLRLKAKLPELTPEEMAKVREAWEQAKALQASAKAPIEITESGATIGKFSNGSHMEIIPRSREKGLYGGNTIKLEPDKTTTITGTLGDTNLVAKRGFHAPGTTLVGENTGGINLLRSPQWKAIQDKHIALKHTDEVLYWRTVSDEFWETVNKPWLDEAIQRGDAFRFVSDPAAEKAIYVLDKGNFVLDKGEKIKSIFGREVDYLKSRGYAFQTDGTAVKVQ